MKEYTKNHIRDPSTMHGLFGIFLNQGVLGSLGSSHIGLGFGGKIRAQDISAASLLFLGIAYQIRGMEKLSDTASFATFSPHTAGPAGTMTSCYD